MSQFGGRRRVIVGPALLLLLLAAGCSRPDGMQSNDGAAQGDQHPVPFHEGERTGPSPSSASAAAQEKGPKPETGLPFRDSQSLPVGTLLTVRLKNPISTEGPGPSGTFEAVVDEPVTIEGNTLVPRGASVAGRIESARASRTKRNQNYVRLTLDSIDVAGRDLPVQTSSLFAHGKANVPPPEQGADSAPTIHLEKGRRLTFRLTEPVYVASQQPLPVR